jgi:hypothetical protein
MPAQHIVKQRLCPRGFEPCPVVNGGYEVSPFCKLISAGDSRSYLKCIDIWNDIESCGGCVGHGMAGIDCSADVHAVDISCVSGSCVICQ